MVVTILAATTALFLATTFVAVHQKMKAEEARDEAEKEALAAVGRLGSAHAALVPLTWSWEILEGGRLPTGGDVTKLRHHLVNVFSTLQVALDQDDLAMAETMATIPEPPRRLPRYPQVPPYLASPEDVANVPPMPEGGR